MAGVTFEGVGKVYPDGTRAVRSFDLEIPDGEFVVLVGPSGCGKTTCLRMLAGLEAITEGEVRIGDRVVNDLEPRDRDIAMVFQNYALYPHMSVYENLAFGLRTRRVPKADVDRRVRSIATVLGLADLLKRKPRVLSGGQRQRVAMGRAIVREPEVFLMDEPLSNLDAKLRTQMRAEIARIQRELRATTLYVTHDQVEAMTMGDRVAVMRKGEMQQVDTPSRLYADPANLFVASFIGSPAMNLVKARIEATPEGLVCDVGGTPVAIPASVRAERPALDGYAGRDLAVGVRPEHLFESSSVTGATGSLTARLVLEEQLGPETLAHLEIHAEPVVTDDVIEVIGDMDAALVQGLQNEALQQRALLIGRFRDAVARGAREEVEIGIDTTRLHFFDLETGEVIGRTG